MDDTTTQLTLWALVDKLDQTNDVERKGSSGEKRLLSVPIWPQWTAREVQVALLEELGYTAPSSSSSTQTIVRVRDAHGALLPLTPTTLKSTPEEPLLLEICNFCHDGLEGELPVLPASFRSTALAIIARLEKRLTAVEAGLVGLQGRRAALVEAELRQIQDALSFMSRKLDQARAPAWVTGSQA